MSKLIEDPIPQSHADITMKAWTDRFETEYDWDLKPPTAIKALAAVSVRRELREGDRQEDWKNALDLEIKRMRKYNVFRKMNSEERARWKNKELHPVRMSLAGAVKRTGVCRCRIIILGNLLWGMCGDTSSPVASSTATKAVLIQAASKGHEIGAFDIESAFLQSRFDETVIGYLPPEWLAQDDSFTDGEPVVVDRALYGHPKSPLAWYRTFQQDLKAKNWVECPDCPGIWKKIGEDAYIIVYVDDCFCTAAVVKKHVDAIINTFDSKAIPGIPRVMRGKKGLAYDVLGVECFYAQKARTIIFFMEECIKKMYVRLVKGKSFEHNKKCQNPAFDERSLFETSSKIEGQVHAIGDFNARECIGSLNWVTCQVRADCAYQCNVLASHTHKASHEMAKAFGRVMKYLLDTADHGIVHEPKNISIMADTYGAETRVVAFGDAAFSQTGNKAISGLAIYYLGSLICWKSKKQSLISQSTGQSELQATSDVIRLCLEHPVINWLAYNGVEHVSLLCGDGIPLLDTELFTVMSDAQVVLDKIQKGPPSKGVAKRHYELKCLETFANIAAVKKCEGLKMLGDTLTKMRPDIPRGMTLDPVTYLQKQVVCRFAVNWNETVLFTGLDNTDDETTDHDEDYEDSLDPVDSL